MDSDFDKFGAHRLTLSESMQPNHFSENSPSCTLLVIFVSGEPVGRIVQASSNAALLWLATIQNRQKLIDRKQLCKLCLLQRLMARSPRPPSKLLRLTAPICNSIWMSHALISALDCSNSCFLRTDERHGLAVTNGHNLTANDSRSKKFET
ncbi:uncharacterized protein MEPE_02133 [Melanopsichium pennsylvanicum]|uniref:Uncharacterized protein n=1 Tax=Melanopsichium pennsylvanicum TaxID=63383 RepID=A0AAJ4XKF0_9BASI|nr:uncharacterized protein MEPE_02133 [Melanopsichium pennsylvanicum]